MTNEKPTLGQLASEVISVERLLLDCENPRLPVELRGNEDQAELATHMAEIFNALDVARPIATYGFYPWEALVVIPANDGHYTVVEGNRRLTAVKGLADSTIRNRFQRPDEWRELAEAGKDRIPGALPCVVVPSRSDAIPALGYRHISGIKPWEPQMQARFVAELINREDHTFEAVAALVGKTKQWVQETYSTFSVFEVAAELDIDTAGADDSYSLLTVALGTTELRAHIGAQRTVEAGEPVIADPKSETLAELFEWVFGSDEAEPVAAESRDIRALAKVIAKPAGLGAIRDGLSLEEAKQKIEDDEYDEREVLLRDLRKAERMLNKVNLRSTENDAEIAAVVEAVAEQTQRLLNEVDELS